MSTFINNLRTLFSFLFDILGDVATFFTTNTLGIIILGIIVFSILVDVVVDFLKFFRK